jgi:hypothetical protein
MISLITFASSACSNSFFGLPNWWKFLPNQPTPPECNVNITFPNDIWPMALAVVDMLLWIAGIVAVISIVISGFFFITSAGNPEHAASARRRLVNSLLGLLIALVATGFVTFVGNSLKG